MLARSPAGRKHKHSTYKHEQHYRYHTHDLLHNRAEFASYKLRQGFASRTDRHHRRDEIMHGTAQDCTCDNPYKRRRAEHHAHYGTENRAETRDIEKLYEKHPPSRHFHKIDSVGTCLCRHKALGVNPKHFLYKPTVEGIAPTSMASDTRRVVIDVSQA